MLCLHLWTQRRLESHTSQHSILLHNSLSCLEIIKWHMQLPLRRRKYTFHVHLWSVPFLAATYGWSVSSEMASHQSPRLQRVWFPGFEQRCVEQWSCQENYLKRFPFLAGIVLIELCMCIVLLYVHTYINYTYTCVYVYIFSHCKLDVSECCLLLFQIHRITDEGIKFKQLYHVTNFPYVAILDPRTGMGLSFLSVLT